MTDSRSNLLLYIGLGCPFCTKVTNFMESNGIQLPIKDVWHDEQARQELVALTGKTQVPCLKIGEQAMLESDDIIHYLNKHFGN